MIICECEKEYGDNPPNECDICGSILDKSGAIEATPEPPAEPILDSGNRFQSISLQYSAEGMELNFPIPISEANKSAIVGRICPTQGIPDLDVSGLEGSQRVSRQHAKLYIGAKTDLRIKNISNSNSLTLKGKAISPTKSSPIEDGDQIVLGGVLTLVVKIA